MSSWFYLSYILSSTAILDLVCETFLKRNVSAILFLSNTELYGRNTAAAQYFLQLTNYLRIPVIAWNADNSGLEKVNRNLLWFIIINSVGYHDGLMIISNNMF